MQCIISCEHASNEVPPRFAHVFAGNAEVLASHQAFDPGAADLARRLGKHLHSPVHLGFISRLLIDLNRSPTNRKSLFTSYSMKFGEKDREWLLRKYYQPYREKVEMAVARMMQSGKPVLHLSIHSFTPVKNDTLRNADIGLLYDPARQCEKDLCTFLAKILKEEGVPLRVRKNYPYLGKTDGFASFFRTKYSAELYAGIEIETNQSLFSAVDAIKRFEDIFCRGIRIALKSHDFSTVESLLRLSRRRDGY